MTTHYFNVKWFNLIYAEQFDIENMKFKICFYINKCIDRSKIKIHFDFKNIFSLKIQLKSPDPNLMHTVWIHNIYNESNTLSASAFHKLRNILKNQIRWKDLNCENFVENIIFKDFNIHHSQWVVSNVEVDNRNHELLNIIDEFQLTQHLIFEIIIYVSNVYDTSQTLNLCFFTSELMKRLLHCYIKANIEQNLNHYFVSFAWDLRVTEIISRNSFCWKKLKQKKLEKVFTNKLNELNQLNLNVEIFTNKNNIDVVTAKLITIIDHAIKTTISRINIIRHSKSEWNKECINACVETQRRRRL